MSETPTPEIILNLWYYTDETGQFIFALAGRAYIASGTDEEKTALLKQLAKTDYLLAIDLPVPEHYVADYAGKMRRGIAHVSELDNPETQLFEGIYRVIEADLSTMDHVQNRQPSEESKIPDNPLFVMTALYRDNFGEIRVLGI